MKPSKFLYTAALALAPHLCFSQQIALTADVQPLVAFDAPAAGNTAAASVAESAVADSETSAPTVAVKTAAPAPAEPKALFARWVDVSEMSESQRYRNEFDQNGEHLFNMGQQRTVLAGHIKLDPQGKYFIGIRASSGQFFNWAYGDYISHDFLYFATNSINGFTPAEVANFYAAYAADPAGAGQNFADKGWNFYVRDLYLSATPVKQLTVEFGSIQIERGYSSEITTFDDDGFIAGERVRLHDSKHLGVDELSFTSAYLGDVVTPNFFVRGDRLKQSNYRQLAAKKAINPHVAVSAEYNWLNATNTLREAAVFKVPETKAIDAVHFELYQRLNSITFAGDAAASVAPEVIKGGSGLALFAEKKAGPVSGDFGYATVDTHYGVYLNSRFLEAVGFSLNGDNYVTGNRIFGHLSYKLNPVVSVFGFYTHTVSGDDYTYCKQGFNAGLKFDLKSMVNFEKKVL